MSHSVPRLIGDIPASYTSYLTPDQGPCAVQNLQGHTDFDCKQEQNRDK